MNGSNSISSSSSKGSYSIIISSSSSSIISDIFCFSSGSYFFMLSYDYEIKKLFFPKNEILPACLKLINLVYC